MEKDLLEKPIVDLPLSTRSVNALLSAGLNTVGDVVAETSVSLRRIPQFGAKSFLEVEDVLRDLGLGFAVWPAIIYVYDPKG